MKQWNFSTLSVSAFKIQCLVFRRCVLFDVQSFDVGSLLDVGSDSTLGHSMFGHLAFSLSVFGHSVFDLSMFSLLAFSR